MSGSVLRIMGLPLASVCFIAGYQISKSISRPLRLLSIRVNSRLPAKYGPGSESKKEAGSWVLCGGIIVAVAVDVIVGEAITGVVIVGVAVPRASVSIGFGSVAVVELQANRNINPNPIVPMNLNLFMIILLMKKISELIDGCLYSSAHKESFAIQLNNNVPNLTDQTYNR